ncbi:MAG: DJ-1/PfpI family protein [Chloroflexi bacterium]|nr:DJ-1/PfpI family protein [Chloroflexota bacterium]
MTRALSIHYGIFGIINKPSIRKCLKRIPKYIELSLDYFSEFALVGLISGTVRGAHGLVIEPDYSLEAAAQTTHVCGIVIPGGQQCISLLTMDPRVHRLVEDVIDGDGFLAVMATAARREAGEYEPL